MSKFESKFRLVSPSVAPGGEAMSCFRGKTSTDVKRFVFRLIRVGADRVLERDHQSIPCTVSPALAASCFWRASKLTKRPGESRTAQATCMMSSVRQPSSGV